jgi:hypothetical protein
MLTTIRLEPTGLDWGCVKTVSSYKDVRDVEIEVVSEPRPQICVQTVLLENNAHEFRYYILQKT